MYLRLLAIIKLLWHGNVVWGLQTLDIFEEDLEILKQTLSSPRMNELIKAICEFYGCWLR